MISLYNEKNEKLKVLSTYEVSDADMGESSISATVIFDKEQNFHPDWYVIYEGEKYRLGVRKPTGRKDTSSLSTTYTLVFKSEREDLKRYTFMDFVELGTDNPQPSSYIVPLYSTLTEFVDRFNLNLRYYMGSMWKMVLPSDYAEDGIAMTLSIDNASLWDVLLKVYETFGVRWVIRKEDGVMQIQVGFPETELEHVFEYGKGNGLVSVERNNALERIITRLRGRGGERNLPPDYFHSGDPDTNTALQGLFFKNLMPKSYRDYIRGYNTGSGTGSWAYNQGVADKVAGKRIAPIDYALSDKENLWGVSYGAIEPNESIYPTLQGATRDGVRLDEVLAVEEILVDGVREPQNTIAIGVGSGGAERSFGKCGNGKKNNHIPDCRNGVDFKIFTDRFVVTNPINTAEVRITLIPAYTNDAGQDISVQFGNDSTVHHTTVLELVDYSNDMISGEVVRTQTISDIDGYQWTLEDIPVGDYRFRAAVEWRANIVRDEENPTKGDIVVNVDTRLTSPMVKEYARETDKGEWKETFDIKIRDVWGVARNPEESDEDYTFRVWSPRAVADEMAVMFSDGLLAGEDYEFRIVGFSADSDNLYQVITTAIKPVEDGWILTLQKSEAELEASNTYLPNTRVNAKVGDHFFFINISMPYDPYVYDAEARTEAYLQEQLAMKDEEFPSFTITPSKVFCSTFNEANKIKAGVKVRVRNTALIGESYISLYIQSLTKRYSANSLNPEWSLTISDQVIASGNPVSTLEGEVDVLAQRVYSNRNAVQEAVRALGSTFLRKDGIKDISYSPTEFKKKVEVSGEGIIDREFKRGDVSGSGFGVYTDENGRRVVEADILVGRVGARFNEVEINQVTYSAGKQVFSAAGMVVSRVEGRKCYFDTKGGSVRNGFMVNDGAFSQRFTDAGVRSYWTRVTAVGPDWIELAESEVEPLVGDNIAQLGNSEDRSRQAALIIDEVRDGGGLVTWYDDIDGFTLSGKDSVNIGRIEGKTWLQAYGSAYIGDRDGTQFVRYEDGKLKIAGTLEVGTRLGDAMTVVEDGVIQSMLLKLGYVKDGVFQIMSGTNGLYDESLKGGGVAAWYGGPMADKEADSSLVRFAQSLFRFDGSGYLAGGNISWDKDGAGSVAGGDLSWDKDGVITLGGSIKISGDTGETLSSILAFINEYRNLWTYDSKNNAVYTKLNLIVEGGGAFGKGSGSGNTPTQSNVAIKFQGKDITYVPVNGIITLPAYPTALQNPHSLIINGVHYDGSKEITINLEGGGGIADAIAWENVLGRPTALSEFDNDMLFATEEYVATRGYITGISSAMVTTALGYTPLSTEGGTISKSSYVPLVIQNTASDLSTILFKGASGDLGYLGFNGASNPVYMAPSGYAYTLYHTGNFNPSNYLPLNGGTMDGAVVFKSSAPAIAFLRESGTPYIRFGATTSLGYGEIGVNSNGDAVFWSMATANSGYNKWNTLIHSGNIGSYALKTDGSNAMTAPLLLAYNSSLTEEKGMYIGTTGLSGGGAFDYASFINIYDRSNSSLQLSWYRNIYMPQVAMRISENGSWSAWKTIAFTDSNVASANYATTAGYATKSAALVNNSSELKSVAYVSGNTFYIGDSIYATTSTQILGKDVRLRYGASATFGLILSENGNVLIGTTTDSGFKLDINGTTRTTELKIGSATLSWDEANQALKISSNLVVEGGGAFGTGSTSGGGTSGGLGSVTIKTEGGIEYKSNSNGVVTVPNWITAASLNGYAKLTDIPTSLPASDVYAWAKKATLAVSDVPDLSSKYAAIGLAGSSSYVAFKNGGYIAYSGGDKWSVTNSDWTAAYGILHEANYTNYTYSQSTIDSKLANYLPLSGGTISSGAFNPLTIKGNSSYAGIGFQKTGDSAPSYLVYVNEWDWRITNANWADSKKILHSGNYSSYALPLSGGTMTGAIMIGGYTSFGVSDGIFYLGNPSYPLYIRSNGIVNINGNAVIHAGNIGAQSVDRAIALRGIYPSVTSTNDMYNTELLLKYHAGFSPDFGNVPSSNSWQNGLLEIGLHSGGASAQFFFSAYKRLYYRSHQTDAWHGVAYLDDNVASATKLQTARTIWGQSFDGTGDISGNLLNVGLVEPISDNSYNLGSASRKFLYAYVENAIINNTTNGYFIGSRTGIGAKDGGALIYAYGNTPISFYTGGERMRILGNGNVLIGTITDTIGKLQVEGDIYATAWIRTKGAAGWYSQDYGGGIYMTDANYVRVYNGKGFQVDSNVLIGNTTDRGHKLAVIRENGAMTASTLHNSALFIGSSNSVDSYGLNLWTEGSGNGFIQQGRTDEEQPRLYNLSLQPFGGNILIGATTDNGAKLQVNGGVTTYGTINMQSVGGIQNAPSISLYDNGVGYYVGSRNAGLGVTDGGCLVYSYGNTPISMYTDGLERMRVTDSGNILIGTTIDSGARLHINASAATTLQAVTTVVGLGIARFLAPNAMTGVTGGMVLDIGVASSTYNSGNIAFRYHSSGNAANFISLGVFGKDNILNVFGSGNVAIGTTESNPTYKLDVQGGDVRFTGNLVVSGGGAFGSDVRYKDILDYTNIDLATIANAPLFTYRWNDREDKKVYLGTSAQYWENTEFGGVVNASDPNFLKLDYGALAYGIGVTVARKVVDHEKRIATLEKENKELKEKLNKYETLWHN